MMNFKMQMRTATAELPWEYDFTMASTKMAIDYADRHGQRLAISVPWFMGLTLFDMTNGRVAATFTYKIKAESKIEEPA